MEQSKPLTAFMELAKFDQSLNEVRHNINIRNLEITKLTKDLIEVEALINNSKQELLNMQKQVNQHEFSMKELDNNLQKQKELLDQVSNQKEYNAVKNSIAQIKQEQHDYETILIDEWNKLDHIKQAVEKKQTKLAQETLEIKMQIQEKKAELNKLELELATQIEKRELLLKNLPAEWLEKYEAMYTKVNNPIVQLLNNSCGACFQEVTAQVISELKHNKLVQCKGCYRFLFF
jgi:predicted  nucleic acid-binding Zn-ribbon protein